MRILVSLLALGIVGNSAFAIVNGEIVKPDEYPARSTVIIMDDSAPICTGTLIGPNLVLTAAHCLVDEKTQWPKPTHLLQVYFGNIAQFQWNDALSLSVIGVRIHADYTNNIHKPANDIALLKIRGDIPAGFTPAGVLTDPSLLQAGMPVLIAGFGNTLGVGASDEPLNRMLRSFAEHVHVPVEKISGMIELYSTPDLVKRFGFQEPQTPHHPEMRNRGGMAAGDSGGPAYVLINDMPVVVGVAGGYAPPKRTIPLYENVATHAGWIAKMTIELESR